MAGQVATGASALGPAQKNRRRLVAKSLLGDFHAREVNGVARTDDNVIIRVSGSIVIGDQAYVPEIEQHSCPAHHAGLP